MKNQINNILFISAFLLTACFANKANAQLSPLTAQYFENQYLANPAMAGASGGFQVYGGLRQQWSMINGTPYTQVLTGEYRTENKAAFGMNLLNDQAGLIKTTRLVGSYAYHLPLNNESQELHFGLSFGFTNQRLMNERITGDPDDISIRRYNEKEMYLDGDFGMAYTDKKLSLQVAIPNMKSFLKRDYDNVANRSTVYASVGYKHLYESGIGIEPKVAFREIKGYDNIVDAGVNVSLINNQLMFMGMYHSSKSATFGIGMQFRALSVLGNYTTETAPLAGYTSGNFELGVGYRFDKKQD